MAHRFSLEAVLKLRQHREEAEERVLAALGAQRQQVEATLGRVREQMRQWTEDRARQTGVLENGAAQQASYARLLVLRDAEGQLERQLEDVRERASAQRLVYLHARSGREPLTELKQTQQAAAEAEARRQEQKRAEDLFLGRWGR